MKKILLPAIFIILIFGACRKGDVTLNVVSATVDGANVNLSMPAYGQAFYDPIAMEYTVNIIGATGTANGDAAILININSNTPIVSGTYLSNNAGFYGPVATILYTAANASSGGQPYISNGPGGVPATVVITSISKNNVAGTFTGTLTYPAVKVITNGKFNVVIKQ